MLIKILGVFDLLAAAVIFAISFGAGIPKPILIFFIVILLVKGAFVLTKSIAAGFDLFVALILLLSFFFSLPQWTYFISGIVILQKGFLSLM